MWGLGIFLTWLNILATWSQLSIILYERQEFAMSCAPSLERMSHADTIKLCEQLVLFTVIGFSVTSRKPSQSSECSWNVGFLPQILRFYLGSHGSWGPGVTYGRLSCLVTCCMVMFFIVEYSYLSVLVSDHDINITFNPCC